MFIRPALDPASETEGARLKVRDPVTMAFLADAGEEKPDSEYWLRRVVEGGVEQRVDGEWPAKAAPLPPVDDTLKVSAGTGEEMVEVHPGPDGVTVFSGDHPAEPATHDGNQ